jgi:hypothetical protein
MAALAGAGVMAVLLVIVLTSSKPRLAATNSRVIASGATVGILPGKVRCQGGEYVPTDAAKLRVFANPFRGRGTQPILFLLRDRSGRTIAYLPVKAGYPEGELKLDLPPLRHGVFLGRLCVKNLGSSPMAFAGNFTSDQPQNPGAYNTPGERPLDEIRVDYFRKGSESWLDIAPLVSDRFPLFKSAWIGPWTMWVGLLLVLGASVAGVRQIVRGIGT